MYIYVCMYVGLRYNYKYLSQRKGKADPNNIIKKMDGATSLVFCLQKRSQVCSGLIEVLV